MLLKTIQITIPKNKILQDISSFSPEENYLMLKIGSDCLLEGRKVITGLSQDEIYEKIKNETKEEIQKLELDIVVEREMSKKMEDRYAKMYETQLDQMKKQIETMDKQIKSYESENVDIINKEVEKIRDKCNAIIEEKEKQNQLNREVFDKALKVSQISNAEKGSKGELKFNDIADTFKDYNKFYLEDKHTQSGQGDFHLHFDEFTVLADAKNYYNKVDKTQRDKIKKDLLKNEHVSFGWLVSLNTNIDKFDKDPIMFEWINTNQCVLYINNLLSYECPEKLLRVAYLLSKQLYIYIKSQDTDDIELNNLRETNYKIMGKVKNMKTSIREINTGINVMKKQVENLSYEIMDILELETKGNVNTSFSLLDDWWDKNIVVSKEECILSSSDIWLRFRQENKELIKELDITTDTFKDYIKTKVPSECRKLKSKKGAIEIINMKMTSEDIYVDTM
jgi:hypothetical protein